MDVYNVTEQYTELINRQKQTLQEAKKRQGQRPRDRKSREHAYGKFMVALMLSGNREQKHLVHSSFVPPAYLPCTAPMTELRHVAIKDLQLETHHRGTYLLLRSITPPRRMTAIMAVMEDKNGDVIMLEPIMTEKDHGVVFTCFTGFPRLKSRLRGGICLALELSTQFRLL